MKIAYKSLAVALMGLMISATSCDKASEMPVDKSSKTILVDASQWGSLWAYVSLSNNTVTETSKDDNAAMKKQNWDIAFFRENLRVNGPEGFSGKAALAVTDKTDFSQVTMDDVKSAKFMGNTMTSIHADFNHGDMGKSEIAVEPELALLRAGMPDFSNLYKSQDEYVVKEVKGYTVDMASVLTGVPTYNKNDKVLIVRGVDGKSYYKLQIEFIKGLKGDQPTGHYILKVARL